MDALALEQRQNSNADEKNRLSADQQNAAFEEYSMLTKDDKSKDFDRSWLSPINKLIVHIKEDVFRNMLDYTFLHVAWRSDAMPGETSSVQFQMDNCELLDLLLQKGANSQIESVNGYNALYYAALCRNFIVVRHLLGKVNIKKGHSPLCAVLEGPQARNPATHDAIREIVTALIKAGDCPFDLSEKLSYPWELEQCALNMVGGNKFRDDLQSTMLELAGVKPELIPRRENCAVVGKKWRKQDFGL